MRRILLAVTGLTPQVITATLFALMCEGPDSLPHAILVLRDPAGHEGGIVCALQRLAGLLPYRDEGAAAGLPLSPAEYALVRRADWWAAVADRTQWPMGRLELATPGMDEEARFECAGARGPGRQRVLDEDLEAAAALGKLAGHGLWLESVDNPFWRAEGFNRVTVAAF